MTKFKTLPLVALLGLGLAACGATDDEDSAVEQRADALEERGDRAEERLDERSDALEERGDTIERRTDDIEGEVDGMDLDGDMDNGAMMAGDMGMVRVTVMGVEPNGGTVYAGLQGREGFGKLDVQYGGSAEPTGDTVQVMVPDVPGGMYAVVAFQDTNGDGTTNLGATGPGEPWGISGYEGGAPNPANALMQVSGDADAEVTLNK